MLTEKELISQEFLEKLKTQIEDIIGEDRFNEAYNLSQVLSFAIDSIKNFKAKYFDLYLEYKGLINILGWVGLPVLSQERVIKMFQYHFTEIFNIPSYDLWAKLKVVLLGIIVLDERDKFKKQLRDALLRNEESFTGQPLIIDNNKKEPTVANWLLDYNRTLGTGEVSGLARTEYFINSINIRSLNEKEKERVKLLFNLYEKLKLSSHTFEGLENEISIDDKGKEGIIKEGVFEPFKMTEKEKELWQMATDFLSQRRAIENTPEPKNPKNKTKSENSELSKLRELVKSYPEGSFERRVVEEEIDKMKYE